MEFTKNPIHIRVTVEQESFLEKKQKQGISMSHVMREALNLYIEEQTGGRP